MATTRPDTRRAARLARASTSGLLLSIGVVANAATSPAVQPTVDVSAVATDNAELTTTPRSDVIGDVDVGVIMRSHGARVTLTGDAGLEFIGYARHHDGDAVLPRGNLDLNAILLERLLFFDGDISASRTRNDPLAAQSDTTSTANTVSSVSMRASPYVVHQFTPTISLNARSDTTVTRNKSAGSDDTSAPAGSTNQHDVVSIARRPTPFGISIDGLHDDTTYQHGQGSTLRTDSLTATLSTALVDDVVVGIVGGHEHAAYSGATQNDTTYGATLQWNPSPRTVFDADAEHHYFGTGWNLHFRDRLPLSAVDFLLTRSASASSSSFGVNGSDSNPAALLGAILSARAPDATSTDAGASTLSADTAVDNVMQSRGLPSSFSQPLQITSESAQLATRATLNFIYNGVRNSLYASAWYQKAVALPGAAATPLATTFDSRQWGGSLGLYHRLMPDVAAAAQVEWSEIDALGARDGDSSHQISETLSLTRRLGPRTSLSCGVRHFNSRVVLNSASTTTDVRENQAFAGLRVQY